MKSRHIILKGDSKPCPRRLYCVDGGSSDSIAMAMDYDTGSVYDAFAVDESWMGKSEKEQAIYIAAAGGPQVSADYDGGPIFADSEIHIPLSESDMAEVNRALSQ